MTTTDPKIVERKPVTGGARNRFLPRHLPQPQQFLQFEALLYVQASRYCTNYGGATWKMYDLDNGSFYMAPELSGQAAVAVDTNCYTGTMSWDAFGLVASLFTLNRMCWAFQDDRRLNDLFYQLKEYAAGHDESEAIFRAID
jgi:hypothetical protein